MDHNTLGGALISVLAVMSAGCSGYVPREGTSPSEICADAHEVRIGADEVAFVEGLLLSQLPPQDAPLGGRGTTPPSTTSAPGLVPMTEKRGDASLGSDADAVALAVQAKEVNRARRHEFDAEAIHLVLCGPQALAILLGQRLNAIGDVVTYERTLSGAFQESLRIRTG